MPADRTILKQGGLAADEARAAVRWPDGKAVVSLFRNADISSVPHELMHIFRREFAGTATAPEAPAALRRDWQAVLDYVGAKKGESWSADMEEAFARAGDAWFAEGRAPVPELQGAFDRLRQWYAALYRGLKDEAGLQPELRQVFERLLDADEASDRALESLVRGIADEPGNAGLREAYAALDPEARYEVFRTAAVQAAQGRRIDVEDLVRGKTMDWLRRQADEAARAEAATRRSLEGDAGAEARTAGEEMLAEAEALDESLAMLERSRPELAGEIRNVAGKQMADHDALLARIDLEERVALEAARCEMRR